MASPHNQNQQSNQNQRTIGNTGIRIAPVSMGCWPIAGVTNRNGVTREKSIATLQAAVDAGVNFFDTAYCYGYNGESERLIAETLGHRRDEIVIASKAGVHWSPERQQLRDASPETIRRECHESLQRLQTDVIDLYYLHGPDPNIPIAESAGTFRELLDAGKIRSVGVSNCNRTQLEQFQAVCPISAYQPFYNMLQRDIEPELLPWCVEQNVSVMIYWPLMKGLLTGKFARDHQFDPQDARTNYPMFNGDEWEKNQNFLDELRPIAADANCNLTQLVISWTLQRPGITAALCGATRPEQIEETAAAMQQQLTAEQLKKIDTAITTRGSIKSNRTIK